MSVQNTNQVEIISEMNCVGQSGSDGGSIRKPNIYWFNITRQVKKDFLSVIDDMYPQFP